VAQRSRLDGRCEIAAPLSFALIPLVLEGWIFGFSVAWPPGPINAEIARRAIARGAGPATAVALGASSGDAIWALMSSLGVGILLKGPLTRLALGIVSTALMLALAALFLHGAWRGFRTRHEPPVDAARFERGGAGYALGLGMALSSPWNLGFWLAVMGQPGLIPEGIGASLAMAASVVAGALSWCLMLIGALTLLRIRIDVHWWEVVAKGATGLFMLGFAISEIARLAAAR
jgi:threonine/homoserine/homoserine lactone efflux protein